MAVIFKPSEAAFECAGTKIINIYYSCFKKKYWNIGNYFALAFCVCISG